MLDPNPSTFLDDPLSAISRAERRNLLISCIIALLVSFAGFIPKKISALGIELNTPEQNIFILTLLGITLYFFFAFLICGLTDFFIWRKKYQDYLSSVNSRMESWSEEDQHYDDISNLPKIKWLYTFSPILAKIRIIFEYLVPIVVGVVSMASLIYKFPFI